MSKLTGFIASIVLMFGMGAVNAAEAPEILGAADYQSMSTSEMSSITGQTGECNDGGGCPCPSCPSQQQDQSQTACGGVVTLGCSSASGGGDSEGIDIDVGVL
jgi:hypothetical protein